MQFQKIILTLGRWIVALLFLQTLYFKFTAQPESVELFSKIGVEPWGRIGLGSVELILAVFLILNRFTRIISFISTLILFGAIITHVYIIGIVVNNDNGLLFLYSVIGFLLSSLIFWKTRKTN